MEPLDSFRASQKESSSAAKMGHSLAREFESRTCGSDKHSVGYFDNGAQIEGYRGHVARTSIPSDISITVIGQKGTGARVPMFPHVCRQCTIITDRATALSRECARSQPSDERTPGIAPPHAVARVNLCVLWVGCQLSLLGGKWPIATTRCDRRRATIDSCASREALNPIKGRKP